MEDELYNNENKNFILVLVIFVFIALIVLGGFIFSIIYKNPVCGDGSCNGNENKCVCPQDCGECNGTCGKCMNFVCEHNECICSKISNCCGNGICERGEDEWSCCIDCNCSIAGMICNKSSLICEIPDPRISNEKALEAVKKYLNLTNLSIYKIDISNTIYNNESAKMICLYEDDVIFVGMCLTIDNNGNIISIIHM